MLLVCLLLLGTAAPASGVRAHVVVACSNRGRKKKKKKKKK